MMTLMRAQILSQIPLSHQAEKVIVYLEYIEVMSQKEKV